MVQPWSMSFNFDNSNLRQHVKKLWKYCQFFISFFAKNIHWNKCLLWTSTLNRFPNLTIDWRFTLPHFFITWMILVIYIVSLFAFDIIGWSQKQDYVLNTLTLSFCWKSRDILIISRCCFGFHGESFVGDFVWIVSSYYKNRINSCDFYYVPCEFGFEFVLCRIC